MQRRLVLAAVLLVGSVMSAEAQAVKVEFLMGKVNLTAQNATLRAVLTEWSRVGGTRIVNPERLTGGPITLELTGVPERQALDILLRDVGGFILGPRQALVMGVSAFDRLVVVAALSGRPAPSGPAFTPTPQPVRRAPAFDAPTAPEVPDDPVDLDLDGPVPPGPQPSRGPQTIGPGLAPRQDDAEARPAPAPTRGNPFGTVQGATRPGVVQPQPPAPGRLTPAGTRDGQEQ